MHRTLEDQVVRPYIIGDAAYALQVNVMKGFVGRGNAQAEEFFSNRLSSARMCVENAFGKLKGRWRILQTPSKFKHMADHVNMIGACCVLHNICQLAKDPYRVAWEQSGTMNQKNDCFYDDMPEAQGSLASAMNTEGSAYAIRDALVRHMSQDMPEDWVPRHVR